MFLFLHGIQQLLVVLVKIILVYIASRILYLHVQTLETVSRVASSDLVRTEVIVHTINDHSHAATCTACRQCRRTGARQHGPHARGGRRRARGLERAAVAALEQRVMGQVIRWEDERGWRSWRAGEPGEVFFIRESPEGCSLYQRAQRGVLYTREGSVSV